MPICKHYVTHVLAVQYLEGKQQIKVGNPQVDF